METPFTVKKISSRARIEFGTARPVGQRCGFGSEFQKSTKLGLYLRVNIYYPKPTA